MRNIGKELVLCAAMCLLLILWLAACPPRVAPGPVLAAQNKGGGEDWPMPPRLDGMAGVGCVLRDNWPAPTKAPEAGWKVTAYVDYTDGWKAPSTAEDCAHGWCTWLSWRMYRGDKDAKKAARYKEASEILANQDCRQWRRALARRMEKAKAERR